MKKMLPESKVEAIRKEGFLNRAVLGISIFLSNCVQCV